MTHENISRLRQFIYEVRDILDNEEWAIAKQAKESAAVEMSDILASLGGDEFVNKYIDSNGKKICQDDCGMLLVAECWSEVPKRVE